MAALVAFTLTPVIMLIYRRLGWIDFPDSTNTKTTHDRPVPRGGGVPILLGVVAALIWFIPPDQHLIGIIIGAVLIAIIGVLDDRCDLNPYLRLSLLIGAAGVVVASGIGIPFINIPFLGVINLDQPKLVFTLWGQRREFWILADLFAIFWIVGLANAVNWSKGLDGQLPGIVIVAAIVIGLLSGRFSSDVTQWPILILAAATAGAYSGFLPWNFYPQKIMPGFGGGALGGYLLAVMAILSTAKVGTLLVVLGVPLIDAGRVIVRRLVAGKSPVWGDRGHLHHYLLDQLGWSKQRISLFYWTVSAALGSVALRLNSQQKFYTIIAIALTLGGALLWLTHFGESSKRPGPSDG